MGLPPLVGQVVGPRVTRYAQPLTEGGPTSTVAVIQGDVPRAGLDFNAQRRAVLDNHVEETMRLARDVRAVRLIFCDAAAYDQGYVAPETIAERADDEHRREIKASFEVFRSASTTELGVEAHQVLNRRGFRDCFKQLPNRRRSLRIEVFSVHEVCVQRAGRVPALPYADAPLVDALRKKGRAVVVIGEAAELFERPKQGFTAPLRQWFARELRDELHDRLATARVARFGVFDADAVQAVLAEQTAGTHDHTQLLWALFHLDRWHEAYVESR